MKVEAALEDLHQEGAAFAADSFASEEPGVVIPFDRRWTLAQILGEADDPIA